MIPSTEEGERGLRVAHIAAFPLHRVTESLWHRWQWATDGS